jgi:hypothetical protein
MAQLYGGMPQSEFVARADNVTQLHIQHVNKATADLNSIMSSLGAKTQVSVDNVLSIAPQGEPASVNFVPNEDVAGIFKDDYHGEFQALKEWFSSLRKEATDIFFPFVDAAGGDSADEWVKKAISGQAINLAEDAEFNRGRTRIYEESQRTKQQAAGAVAAMGFSLPTGSLLAARQEADFIANRGMSELNRDLTIRVKELNLDLVKFAVAQVNNLRSVAVSGMTSYLNAFASLPGSAAQYAQQKASAKTAMWEAGRNYYLAQLNFKQHLLDTSKANMQKDIQLSELKAGLDDKEIERALKSLQTAAEVYGRLVAGAMAGINSHISLGANNNASVSWNWSTTE